MKSIAEAVRTARMIHFGMFVWIFLVIFAGERVHPKTQEVAASLQYGFLICVVCVMVFAVVFRQMTAGQAEDILRRTPDDGAAIARWWTGQLVSYVMAESVAIFGFALRFLGMSFGRVVPFYAATVILLTAFRPTDPRS